MSFADQAQGFATTREQYTGWALNQFAAALRSAGRDRQRQLAAIRQAEQTLAPIERTPS